MQYGAEIKHQGTYTELRKNCTSKLQTNMATGYIRQI
jgi:hypothetical protein